MVIYTNRHYTRKSTTHLSSALKKLIDGNRFLVDDGFVCLSNSLDTLFD